MTSRKRWVIRLVPTTPDQVPFLAGRVSEGFAWVFCTMDCVATFGSRREATRVAEGAVEGSRLLRETSLGRRIEVVEREIRRGK